MRILIAAILALLASLFASGIVLASTFQQATLEDGQSIEVAGKTILLEAAYYDLVLVNVDGYKKTIYTFEAEDEDGFIVYTSSRVTVNGVDITIVDVIGSSRAILNISVPFNCGNNICESTESKTICCKDCGCDAGKTCVDNQCVKSTMNECLNDSECDDSNICTLDVCAGIPRKCFNALIDYCRDNDDCCPDICVYENDSDCPVNQTVSECITYRDCKKPGQSPCNLSSCESGKCIYEIQEGCGVDDTCLAINSTVLVNETNFTCSREGLISPAEEKESKPVLENIKQYIGFIVLVLIIVTAFILAHNPFRRRLSTS